MSVFSNTTLTPSDSTQVPAVQGSTPGNFTLDSLASYMVTANGYNVQLTLDNSTYTITPKLYDGDGNLVSTGTAIDLPIESLVTSGTYDSVNKKIVLTLQSGSKIDVPVGDLVSGLVSTSDIVDNLTTQDSTKPLSAKQGYVLNSAISGISRHTRLTDFDLADLQSAVADQDLAKYGLHVGDYKTMSSGYTYVIAGLNVMKGTHAYTCTSNHVGLIVIPHATAKWNTSNSTSGGYASSNLHSYLTGTVLTQAQSDLSSRLYSHYKLYSTAINSSGYNKFGTNSGCSSSWVWSSAQYISALTEMQVYGGTVWSSSGYDTGEADQQLPVFKEFKHTEIFGNEYVWLRDVASSSSACRANDNGLAGSNGASGSAYVAGLILYH